MSERAVLCTAPGRAGIIGNPTDMYGGSVISCSVGMRAWARVEGPAFGTFPEGEGEPHAAPAVMLETEGERCRITDHQDLRPQGDLFDIGRAILDYAGGGHVPPLACRITYGSEIPMQSGMSGSTALLVAMLQGLLAWRGEVLSKYRLAERARYIELNHLEVVCGYQDAYMCTFGGLNYMDFRGKQFYRSEEAELFATIEPLGDYAPELPFLLGYTGVQHASGAVHRPIRERWLEGEREVVKAYARITEIARAGKKALLLQDWPALGRLMNENHAIQRDLGGSGPSNERLIAAALRAGAPGAKLAGAGSGGTIIALWPWEDVSPLEDALYEAGASKTYRLKVSPGVTIETCEG